MFLSMRGPEGRKGGGRGGLESVRTKRRHREDSGGVAQCVHGDQAIDCTTEEWEGNREGGGAVRGMVRKAGG